MQIKETVTRDCCQEKDLVRMNNTPYGQRYYFCRHCGRHHRDEGGSEPESPGIQPMPWPWEEAEQG